MTLSRMANLAGAILLVATVIGCSQSGAMTKEDVKNFKGSPPPADVWQKVGQSKNNFANHEADYGKIPGQNKADVGATHGPSGG